MPRAFIIGGTGLIGRAAARRQLAAGWRVDLTGRDPARLPADIAAAGGRFIPADREDFGQLGAAFGDGADLLVDCLCYTAHHAELMVPLARHAGSTVMISAKAVYVDAVGNHANSPTAPRFDGPISEAQPTTPPAGPDTDYRSRDGYGANKVAAERVLLDSGPSALQISRTIARLLGHDWQEVLLDDGAEESLGRHPWDAPHPVVLDTTAATLLGYTPAGDYAATVTDEVEWLVSLARDGAPTLPGADDPYFGPMLDYGREDRYLRRTA